MVTDNKNPTDSKKSEPDRAVEGIDYWTFTDKPFIRDGENFSQRRRVTLELYQEGENTTKAITPKFCEVASIDVSSDKKEFYILVRFMKIVQLLFLDFGSII